MQGTIITVNKFGRDVFANQQMDEARHTECLCMNCKQMHSCVTAKEGLRLCQLTDIAFMVTRCPKFIKD